ncbi:MAG: polysaccharide biosynthesis/export family protein [Zetaproteobacteria bacterium]|nr:polysaccharide biosynthesis/export family protein [Zetaproteobacteria bacterium]
MFDGGVNFVLKILCVSMCLLSLSSCALFPGMSLKESLYHKIGQAEPPTDVNLYAITPTLLAEMNQKRLLEPEVIPDRDLMIDDTYYEYRVQAQDILQVIVWDHPELTSPAGQYRSAAETGSVVHANGKVFFPYVGEIAVAGKTVNEIREVMTYRMADFVEKPQIDVRVAAFRSQHVYVTGEVMKPGVLPISDDPMRVLDAVHMAGGVQVLRTDNQLNEPDLQHVELTRAEKTYLVDLDKLIKNGDVSQNYILQDGDVLHVPDNMKNKVFVLGEVRTPKSIQIRRGTMTLAEAISDAGGVSLTSANASRIYVIRGEDMTHAKMEMPPLIKPVVYRLDASSPDALILADQFYLDSRDVVFVSTAPIAAWNRVLGQLTSTIQSVLLINTVNKALLP